MEKRVLVAIALSLLVLLTWSAFVSKTYHVENKEVIKEIPPAPPKPVPAAVSPATPLKFSKEYFQINFNQDGAYIQDIIFQQYQGHQLALDYGFFFGEKTLRYKVDIITPDNARFVYKDENKQIVKDFIFSNTNYNIELRIQVKNLSTVPLLLNYPLLLGVIKFNGDPARTQFQSISVATPEKTLQLNGRKDGVYAETKFLSLRDKYFCAIVEPVKESHTSFVSKIDRNQAEIGLQPKERMLDSGETAEYVYRVYLGPQDLKLINQTNPAWATILHYGTFDFISHILLQILEFIHRVVGNWGWTIIIISILIYFMLYPLTLKQMRSMKEMQILQPKIKELQNTYKDNPQKLNRAIMELYREHKVNPFGGCLPMLLQIPIFFALYQVLSRAIALKGAQFLWIKDLSAPDRLFTLSKPLPIIGAEINILPILMMVGMFLQQKKSAMQAATKEQAEQQKLMLFLFPLIFGFIFYHMPSGLVLYWFVNSTLTLIYQFKISH